MAQAILVIIYYMLRDGATYHELGADYLDQRRRPAIVRNAVRRLEHLGYKVTLEAA